MTAKPERHDKRDAILDAALTLFAERGFHGTAVPLLAAEAEVGAGTLYRYFENKEAIVNALYLKWKWELGRFILEGFPASASAREQFSHFWQRAALFARENQLAFKFLELHHHAPYLDKDARSMEAEVLAPALQFFAATSAQKITKPLPTELLGSLVWGALVGLVKSAWEGRLALTPEVIDAAEQCCWEAIRA